MDYQLLLTDLFWWPASNCFFHLRQLIAYEITIFIALYTFLYTVLFTVLKKLLYLRVQVNNLSELNTEEHPPYCPLYTTPNTIV